MENIKILVTVKRVLDPEMIIKIEPDGSGIDAPHPKFTMNPFDEIALEEALRLKEAVGGEVVIASIGCEDAQLEMKSGLAMGADRGLLVLTGENVDADAVARILVELVKDEKPDLVLMGKQASDTDGAQVPQLLAEYLDWAQACFASRIEIDRDRIVVHREVDAGTEVVEFDPPGVISADLRLNEPRYAQLQDILKAKKKEINKISISDLGVDTAPKSVIKRYNAPPARRAGRIVADVAELVSALKAEAKIL